MVFLTYILISDNQDVYNQPISKLVEFIVASYHQNPDISLEVFVHKAEKLQEDDKIGGHYLNSILGRQLIRTWIENFRQIHERVSDRLLDISPAYEQMQLNFHLTSVYDHSLHEAFSKVLHKLIESLPFLEELLNVFCAVSSLIVIMLQTSDNLGSNRTPSRLKRSYSTRNRGCILQPMLPLWILQHIIYVATIFIC